MSTQNALAEARYGHDPGLGDAGPLEALIDRETEKLQRA